MWSNARVNIQNVKAETNSAILVRLPNKSKYKDFEFWVSKKCVKDGSHSYELLVGINTDFTYKAKRTGKNFNVLDERELSGAEILEAFSV